LHQKSDLGTTDLCVWLLSFQNGAQGEAILGDGAQLRNEQSKQNHHFVFM